MDMIDYYRSPEVPFLRVSAPMVRYTKLPFRMLVREYGVDLAYTPMIMADSFTQSAQARDIEFTTCADDHPLIVQLASKDPSEFRLATELLAPYCEGVDINCGCPQRWAIQEGLGSALLRRPERIAEMLQAGRQVAPRWRTRLTSSQPSLESSLSEELTDSGKTPAALTPFSVSAKIRYVPCDERAVGGVTNHSQVACTVEVIRRLVAMDADWVTVHCRTPNQRSSQPADWEVLREVIAAGIQHNTSGGRLPIILNGDVNNLEDAYSAYATTKCDGVMVARGLLFNPKLFVGSTKTAPLGLELQELIYRWLNLTTNYQAVNVFQNVHQQTCWMMQHHLDKTRRLMLHSTSSFAGLTDWLEEYWTSYYATVKQPANFMNPLLI